MKTSFEVKDKVNGRLTMVIEEDDFQSKIKQRLKELQLKANMPGFRPGKVPMGLIVRQYGDRVKYEQINELLNEGVKNYINENKLNILGQPLEAEGHEPVDLDKPAPYTFAFDIPLQPDIDFNLSKDDILDYYEIQVTDEMVDEQVNMIAADFGHQEKVEEYSPELRDMVKGDLRQLDEEGNSLEGGITVDDALLMPQYMSDGEQKALFAGAKVGDIIAFNPKKAYAGNNSEIAALLKMKKEEVKDIDAEFSFQVLEISRYVNATIDQELFDKAFGEGNVSGEEEFRQKIAEQIHAQFSVESDWRLIVELRQYALEKISNLTFPEAMLKRVIKANNKDKDEAFIEEHFAENMDYLKWDIIKGILCQQFGLKVTEEEVTQAAKGMARHQYAQYGFNNLSDEFYEKAAKSIMEREEDHDRLVQQIIDRKIILAVKPVISFNVKPVSLEEFRKLGQQ